MMTKKVQLNLYVPEKYRDMLQRLAGERMLERSEEVGIGFEDRS